MKINYNTLTAEELEEQIEFIDWSMIPSKLLTEDIKKNFKDISGLEIRIWFEDLLSRMILKEDKNKYPDYICFFIGNKWYMTFNKDKSIYLNLWYSSNHITSVFEKKYSTNYYEINTFIKNIVENYFKINNITPRDINVNYLVNWKCTSKNVKL